MEVFERLAEYGVVPVIVINDAKDALPLADALLEGGLPVVEITLRTPAALEAIELIAVKRPEVLVGAGTVIDEEQVPQIKSAGASFALSPGCDPMAIGAAKAANLPFMPGVMTTSDIQTALRLGCRWVKFFPAMASGGLPLLKSLAEPYRHTGIRFNPTGGISIDNMRDWLDYSPVFAVGVAGSPARLILRLASGPKYQQRRKRHWLGRKFDLKDRLYVAQTILPRKKAFFRFVAPRTDVVTGQRKTIRCQS